MCPCCVLVIHHPLLDAPEGLLARPKSWFGTVFATRGREWWVSLFSLFVRRKGWLGTVFATRGREWWVSLFSVFAPSSRRWAGNGGCPCSTPWVSLVFDTGRRMPDHPAFGDGSQAFTTISNDAGLHGAVRCAHRHPTSAPYAFVCLCPCLSLPCSVVGFSEAHPSQAICKTRTHDHGAQHAVQHHIALQTCCAFVEFLYPALDILCIPPIQKKPFPTSLSAANLRESHQFAVQHDPHRNLLVL